MCGIRGSASGKRRFLGKWNDSWRHGVKGRRKSADGKELSETTKPHGIRMRKTKKGRREEIEGGGGEEREGGDGGNE